MRHQVDLGVALPRELDEAAMMDGAGPLRVLWSIIIPQSYPALIAITVFHIVFAWNDYFGPLVYLSTNRAAWPISVAPQSTVTCPLRSISSCTPECGILFQ